MAKSHKTCMEQVEIIDTFGTYQCLDHVGQLTRSRKWSTKRGGEHHIATGHGPMVQGGLLTAHPGGVHGGGWTPGGGSSFRHGARAASPGTPDLEMAAAQRGYREKDFDI